jgi:hypothetical protein
MRNALVLLCLVAAPLHAQKLRLSICVDEHEPWVDAPDEWYVCDHKGRALGESRFIDRYYDVTGNNDLDEFRDHSYRKKPLIIAGALTAAFTSMTALGLGFGIACAAENPLGSPPGAQCPSRDSLSTIGLVTAGFGLVGLVATLTIGFPLAAREPRNHHRLSRAQTQAAVDAYNAALH